MAQQELVTAVRQAGHKLSSERGRAELVAILPSSEEQPGEDERFAVVFSAPWLKEHSVSEDLARVGRALQQTVPFELQASIARIVAMPSTDPFVAEVRERYSSRWTGEPIVFAELAIGGRPVHAGVLIDLETPTPKDLEASAGGGLSIPEEMPSTLWDQFDETGRVRREPLSSDRVSRFKEDFRQDRLRVALIEHLFSNAGTLLRHSVPSPDDSIAVHTVLRRAPFLDISTWAEYRTWDLGLAFERKLGESLIGLLQRAPVVGKAPRDDWPRQRHALFSAATEIGGGRLAFLYDAHPGIEAAVELTKGLPRAWWNSPLQKFPGTIGQDSGVPVTRIFRQKTSGTKAFIVDLARFARLTLYPVDEQGRMNSISITEIDENRANELAHSQAGVQQLAGLSDRLRQRFFEERVELHVEESWRLELIDSTAAAAIQIAEDQKSHHLLAG